MEALKATTEDWVGSIPESWGLERMRYSLSEINVKNSPIKTEQILSLVKDKGVMLYEEKGDVGNKAKEDITGYKVAFPNTLIVNSMNILIGSVGISNYKGCVSPVYYVFKETEKSDLRYINYIFNTREFQKELRKYANGILEIRLRVSATDIFNRKIPMPTKDEQTRIADFLDEKCAEIDKLSEDIQKQIEILEDYKNTIISNATTQGIRKNRRYKESGIDWCHLIPEDWEPCNPKALFSQRNDRIKNGDEQLTSSQEYGIIPQAKFMEITGNKVVTVMKDFSILKHVEPEDFVISMRSFQGGLEYSEVRGCISSAYVMLIPNKQFVVPRFYRWFLKSSRYINAIQSTSNLIRDGQAMRYANFAQIKLFKIPLNEQNEIADYLDRECSSVDSAINAKREQLETLLSYKKSIIYEYVTGKKRVKGAL